MPSFRIRGKTSVANLHVKSKPSRRLSFKTSPFSTQRSCVNGTDDWASREVPYTKRQVYLVTLPHPKETHSVCDRELVAPGSKSKRQILECFLDAAAHPAYADGRSLSRGTGVSLDRAMVSREYHKADGSGKANRHDHIPVMGSSSFRFRPVKQALLDRRGLAPRWSCTHSGYWSAVRYVHVPSHPKRPLSSLDATPVLWPDGAHPPLDQCCDEPLTAAALKRRPAQKQMAAAEHGKQENITELDVFPVVVNNGFRLGTGPDDADLKLVEFAKENCSTAMQQFLFRLDRRDQLKGLTKTTWKWETVGTTLAAACMSRMALLDAAAKSDCVCGGQWATQMTKSFFANEISPADLCTDIYNALEVGRGETTAVLVMAGARGGEGKSLFLKGLTAVFGEDDVFHAPEPGRFPLVDLVGVKAVFLDDWRFGDEVMPYATQCRWYDGSVVKIPQPQNKQGTSGHMRFQGGAPIFATTKLDDMEELKKLAADDLVTGKPRDVNASMCFRRCGGVSFPRTDREATGLCEVLPPLFR